MKPRAISIVFVSESNLQQIYYILIIVLPISVLGVFTVKRKRFMYDVKCT